VKIDAILWDYDGTLVNSVPKNMAVTKQILSIVSPQLTGKNLSEYLKSEEAYQIANHRSKNWQDLYLNYYGMTEPEMLEAGTMWTEYQLKNQTPVELFPGIKQTINQIKLPQGICSQNSSDNINQLLEKGNLVHKFSSIVGYDDVPSHAQKPSAYGGLKCLKEIFETTDNKIVIYVGDHEADVEFARNIEKKLAKNSKVFAIAAKYSGADTESWTHKPDFEIETPNDLLRIVNNIY